MFALAAVVWAVGPVLSGWPTHELNVLKTTEDWPPCSTDADLIVAAVNALPDLLDQLDALEAELDIDTATSNRSQLQSKAEQALSINVTYLSLTTPTTAQNTAQIKALTRQVSAVIRLLLQKLDNLAGT
jgi:hypothetical protein